MVWPVELQFEIQISEVIFKQSIEFYFEKLDHTPLQGHKKRLFLNASKSSDTKIWRNKVIFPYQQESSS